jgi:hypothetical protein
VVRRGWRPSPRLRRPGRCNSAGSFHHGDKHRAPLESSR